MSSGENGWLVGHPRRVPLAASGFLLVTLTLFSLARHCGHTRSSRIQRKSHTKKRFLSRLDAAAVSAMPSAAQRRRRAKAALEPPAHSKVIHLEDDDGWTHVARTSTKGARSTAKAVPPEFRDASQNIASRDAKIEVHYTAQELARHYDRIASAWRACPERASLAESIRSHASVASAITSSVCLGLGSPSRMFMTMGSLKQLAIWLDMLNISQCFLTAPQLFSN